MFISICAVLMSLAISAQNIYKYEQDDAKVVFFSKKLDQHIPHVVRMYNHGKAIHGQIWQNDSLKPYVPKRPLIYMTDWEDDGNAGVSTIPQNIISVRMAPLNFSYFIAPYTERYHHLFRHEYTHMVMGDKPGRSEKFWRSFTGGKFSVDSQHPFSALWSYLGSPRWYTPRWYQEGIACFIETWTGGGVGRALSTYDEMYFRSIVREGESLYSVVGLETEGTASDFQVGTNSYLYGTRFVNFLQIRYGFDKIVSFYDRTAGSKASFSRQFKAVYGRPLREVWEEWQEYEIEHQKEQLALISEYPLTEVKPVVETPLGSMSPMVVDESEGVAYAAVNYPGDFAHIERIDLATGERDKLTRVEGAMLYQTSYLALDKAGRRLIYTIDNGNIRGLAVYDLDKGRQVERIPLQRISNIVYDNANDCLWGTFVNTGTMYICRYDPTLKERELLYAFPFGKSVFDLDVSHDGKWLSATMSGDNGEQTLVRFSTEDFEKARYGYEVLYTFEDSNLGQFRFTPDGKAMIGSSYYTGVSNLWRLDLLTKELDLLSNTQTGLFSPVQLQDGNLLALEFMRNGMRPVKLSYKVLYDANAVTLLGQKAYESEPERLDRLAVLEEPLPQIEFGDVYDSIEEYSPFRELRFTGAYPEISGFRDTKSWNRATPVLGYRISFQDPLGLHSLNFALGISPWSHNRPQNRYHAEIDWKYRSWNLNAALNPTSFYDLFGPVQSSRKGWSVSAGYSRRRVRVKPYNTEWGFRISSYGNMESLPMFQEVKAEKSTFQTVRAYYTMSRLRSTLGATMSEAGWQWQMTGHTYLVGGKLYPNVTATYNQGFLIPVMRNTCFWLRGAVGQNFGDMNSVYGNDFFGGFGNNLVDYRGQYAYRNVHSMPGADIDFIRAHSFGKLTAELNLTPIRYDNFGLVNLYPTYSQFSIFSSGLITDPWGSGISRSYVNVGIQLTTEIALFKYLNTKWSVGYACIWGPEGYDDGAWLFSLKLL